jgi:hypothetical protein
MKLKTVHFIAALLATLMIALFFVSTVLVEAVGGHPAVTRVKSLIVVPGLFVLVPAIAVTGGTGFVLSRGWQGPLVARKKRRMPVIAANGLLILVPAAIVLGRWAAAGAYDARFYVVQAVELLAGGTNLILMGLNMRDGLRLRGRLRPSQPVPPRPTPTAAR